MRMFEPRRVGAARGARVARGLGLLLHVGLLAACGGGGGGGDEAPADPALQAAARDVLARMDGAVAADVPDSGEAALAFADGCFLEDGLSRAERVARFDADPQAGEALRDQVGSTRELLGVRDLGTTTLTDGSTRRLMEVRYRIRYADGSVDQQWTADLVSGNTSGLLMADGSVCATPTNDPGWRWIGNRRAAAFSVTASNTLGEYRSLQTGQVLDAALHSRVLRFNVADPTGRFTYAILTGPGLGPGGGSASIKMIAPRLKRDEAVFAGQWGHYLDLEDDDPFSICRDAEGAFAPAAEADCVQHGAVGAVLGGVDYADPAVLDADFASLRVRAGDVYTLALHDDDGWRAVNGQAGRSPVVTYTATLEGLPYEARALAGLGGTDGYPGWAELDPDAVAAAASASQLGSWTQRVRWIAPPTAPDGATLGLGHVATYRDGRVTAGAAYPAVRNGNAATPGPGVGEVSFTAAAPDTRMQRVDYGEIGQRWQNRNGVAVARYIGYVSSGAETAQAVRRRASAMR